MNVRAYVKPELFFENFELYRHIAKCEWVMNQTDPNSCIASGSGITDGSDTIVAWQESNNNCDIGEMYCNWTYTDETSGVTLTANS